MISTRRLPFGIAAIGISVSIALLTWGIYRFWASELKPDGGDSQAVSEVASGHHHHDDHIDISAPAARSLGVRLEEVKLSSFARSLHLPAEVIEKPGQSGLAVTAPVQGIIRQIHLLPGQSIENGDLLFTLQVADEPLEAAQLSLLESVTRIAVAETELERLNPLAETGAIVGRRKLELEYQLKQLTSEQSARIQELQLRGLSAQQVESIIEQRRLVNEIEIRLETRQSLDGLADRATASLRLTSIEGTDSTGWQVAESSGSDGPIFTVERLDVFPGRLVRKGEELCHIANHYELFLRGDAFESDVVAIRNAMQHQWKVTAEMGLADSRIEVENLTISHLDNHVDPLSQTFPFYMALPNRVVGERMDSEGRLFRSWQFKPGQRAHVYLPTDFWPDSIVLPREAIVRSGPESFAFRLAPGSAFQRRLAPSERLSRLDRMRTWELEPVPVEVLHQDRRSVVIAQGDQLNLGDLVVVSRAYQVYLAWKLQLSGEGGGHDHHH